LTTSGARERLDTGERKRRGLEEVEEGLEVLTADLIELRWFVRGDRRRWLASALKNRGGRNRGWRDSYGRVGWLGSSVVEERQETRGAPLVYVALRAELDHTARSARRHVHGRAGTQKDGRRAWHSAACFGSFAEQRDDASNGW
jgi:hypothetical protein